MNVQLDLPYCKKIELTVKGIGIPRRDDLYLDKFGKVQRLKDSRKSIFPKPKIILEQTEIIIVNPKISDITLE